MESYKLGLVQEFVEIARLCLRTADEKPEEYRGQDGHKCTLINALVSHYLNISRNSSELDDHSVQQITELINLAVKLKKRDPLTNVHRGSSCLLLLTPALF